MHSKSNSKEIIINNEADELIAELFKSLLNRHQINLEKLLKSGDFIFNYSHLLYYKCHKMS